MPILRGFNFVFLAASAMILSIPAQAQLDGGLVGVWTAQGQMAANPPLPMTRYESGAWKISVAPAYFFGKPESDSVGGNYQASGKISGGGGGICASYAFANGFGGYIWALTSIAKGNFDYTPSAACPGCSRLKLDSVDSSYHLLTAGAVYQAIGGGSEGISVPIFAGPLLSYSRAEQMVARYNQAGTLLDDFDMKVSDVSLGLAVGVQAAIPLRRGFELNPFAIMGAFFRDDCRSYAVTRQGTNSGFSSSSASGCSGTRQVRAGEDRLIATGGINAVYVPWNLSLNVTSPFLGSLVAGDDAKVSVLTLSWSFGPKKD